MEENLVLIEHPAEGVARIVLNRPDKRNCMSPRLNRQMMRVLDALEFREDVGVLVLSGEGTAWSAGNTYAWRSPQGVLVISATTHSSV